MKKLSINKIFITIFTITMICSLFLVYKVGAQTKDLKISNVEITEKSSGVTGDITSSSSDEINDTITFHKLNDYVIYKIKIDNNLDSDITIKTISDNNQNEYITYEYNKHENEVIDSKGSLELLVKVKYSKELTDTTKRDQTSSVRLSITYEENGKTKNTNLIINPKTYDNISISVVLFIISSAGLMICLTKNKKGIKNIIIVTAITILLTPAITKAVNLDLNFDFKTELKIYDKVVLTYVVDNEEKQITIPYGTNINDIDFGFDAGYSVTNWKLEDNLPILTNMIISEDMKIVGNLSYTAKPEIVFESPDKFSYGAPNAKAYYVTTGTAVPSAGSVSDSTDSLDEWTTSTSFSTFSIHQEAEFCVYAIDENNNVSSNKSCISYYKVTFKNSSGVEMNDDIVGLYYGHFNYCYSEEYCSLDFSVYALDGSIAKYSLSDISPQYTNLVVTKNGIEIPESGSYEINETTVFEATVELKDINVTIDFNGGTNNNSSDNLNYTIKYDSTSLNKLPIPIKDGYVFEGYYTGPTSGEKVFDEEGKQNKENSNFWRNASGYIGYTGPYKWIYLSDIFLYANWRKPITITTVDYNTFSYSSEGAVAYYVSNTNAVPNAPTTIQDSFELDSWTTATSTGDLNITSSNTYYVWAKYSDGTIANYPEMIKTWKISKENNQNYYAVVKSNDVNGEVLSSDLSSNIYVLNGSTLYISFDYDSQHCYVESIFLDFDYANFTDTYVITKDHYFSAIVEPPFIDV